MLYYAQALPPTAQLQALVWPLRLTPTTSTSDATELDKDKDDGVVVAEESPVLVVNKHSHITLYTSASNWQDATDRKVLLDVPLQGTVASLAVIKLPGHAAAQLLVLTTAFTLFSLSYSPSEGLKTTSSVSLVEVHARVSERPTITIDPLLRCLAIHTYAGLIRIIPLIPSSSSSSSRRKSTTATTTSTSVAPDLDLKKGYTLRLAQLNLLCITFLPSSPTSEPLLALTASSLNLQPELHTYTVSLAEKELLPGPVEKVILDDPGAELIIPAKGGVVVVGEEWIAWVPVGKSANEEEGDGKGKGKASAVALSSSRGRAKKVGVRTPVGEVTAWTPVEGTTNQFLLGDIYGKLQLLTLESSSVSSSVTSMTLVDLGDTSSPMSLVSLSPTLLYVASRFADSQFVTIPSLPPSEDAMTVDPPASSSEIELLDSIPSLAPIMDCCLVEADGGGTSVVTCSGAYKGGSLRVVRAGVGLTELANLDMEGIRGVWSLKRGEEDLLALNFFTETRVLSFGGGASEDDGDSEGVEEVEIDHFAAGPSVFVGAFGGLTVQVTDASVNYEGGKWEPKEGKKITLAAVVGEQLVLTLDGGALVVLREESGALGMVSSTALPNEAASLSCSNLCDKPIAIVGLWTSQSVLLLSLPDLTPLSSTTIPTSYLIRSSLVITFHDSSSYLLVGLGDGSLVSFVVGDGGAVKEETRKMVTLGTSPIFMTPFGVGGGESVLVSSDRPTVVSREGDRLKYSSVNLKGVTSATPFSAPGFPSSLALASATSLRIGKIEEIQSVDIRTIPLGDDEPRRIAYDDKTGTFGVVCLRREIDRSTGEQEVTASVKVLDAKSFDVLASIPLNANEDGESIVVASPTPESTCFIVGTSFRNEVGEAAPSSGRLLAIATSGSDASWQVAGEHKIGGCAYALASLSDGHFAAAIQSQVIAFTLSESLEIKPVATWSGKFVSLTLSTCADSTLLVGDGIGSVTILRFSTSPTFAYKLEEVARDHRTLYIVAASPVDTTSDTDYIGAEQDFNLFTVKKEDVTTTRSMADEQALSSRGVFHLGELVSKFVAGSFVQQYGESSGAAQPRLVFGTSAGSMNIIADVSSDASKTLAELERNLRHVVKGLGNLSQEEWRAFKSDHRKLPSAGFLDGSFIELFATLEDKDVEAVLAGASEHEKLALGAPALLKLVDELARLH